ncbi:hypothetical protein Acj9p080 [Acinetobacter phage Acj9]|uniref:Conserved hypothetical phage protein n=1 Tax=Acinetobacter phage Acj9 TaxID=760939 RepID=E5EPL4_9CAUD|nr:hypothetical protein Acj9p080 [Acinetobacter phage Acj9]ADG59980.1 conserved hypothetical phage protein [Acinetobacter phage Acj9]
MKILYIPCRFITFNADFISGGLESVQLNFIKSLSKDHEIDYMAFGDENFGPYKVNPISIDYPIVDKYTLRHGNKIIEKIKTLDYDKYDAVVTVEAAKGVINGLVALGLGPKIRNLLATPLDPKIRTLVSIWRTAIFIHQNGGKNLVPTDTFRDLTTNVYSKMNSNVAEGVIDFDYWAKNNIISEHYFPAHMIEVPPTVKESNGVVVQAQRYDLKFRKTNVALESMAQCPHKILAFLPRQWAPPKKYLKEPFVHIDVPRVKIQEAISEALVLVNTCHDTGTIEHGSMEAIEKGVPVLQLIQRGYAHATLEHDPTTQIVWIEEGMTTPEIIAAYSKALNEFTDTYEQRVARAMYLYEKYKPIKVLEMWETALLN